MVKILVKFFAVFLMVFLAGCAADFDKKSNEILIDNGQNIIKINIEIADDSKEMAKGMMFREMLEENSGMLFVSGEEDNQIFWMKNTLIPLDMIFINKNMEIVDIKNAVPCSEEPCELYKSSKPAKYVLEVNSGFTAKKGIRTGNHIAKLEIVP